jgi:hypothetical protein
MKRLLYYFCLGSALLLMLLTLALSYAHVISDWLATAMLLVAFALNPGLWRALRDPGRR